MGHITMTLSDPSTWRFLAGSGNNEILPELSANAVMNLGANGSYQGVMVDTWDETQTYGNGLTRRQHYTRFAQEIKRLGGLIELMVYPWAWTSTNYNQHVRDTINNVGTEQDDYMNWMTNYVSGIKPHICQILNEVVGDGSGGIGSSLLWNNYIALCNRVMSEMNTLNPNMIYTTSSIPFWWLDQIATRNFNVPAGCKLYFDYHYYYWYFGTLWSTPNNVGGAEGVDYAYWHATTPADLAAAKTKLYNYWLGEAGMQAMWNNGKIIFINEIGTCLGNGKTFPTGSEGNPNWQVWMKDAIDFFLQHNLGFSFLDWTGYEYYNSETDKGPHNSSPAAFWTNHDVSDNALNALGRRWKELVVTTPPEVTLPFRDDFIDLSKWTPHSGAWDVS